MRRTRTPILCRRTSEIAARNRRHHLLQQAAWGPSYPHQSFDDGDRIAARRRGAARREHARPLARQHQHVLLLDDLAQTRAVFTGDTLFVGDVGRPDLREDAAAGGHAREALAAQLYHSTAPAS
ncbi:MAG: hypothetical protein WKG07_39240 [Hymenobacter sp.]